MPAPSTGRALHIDVPLSNVVVGRRPEGFIADALLPVTSVSKQSDIYYKYNHLEWFRDTDRDLTLRAPGTEANKVHMTVTSDTYFAPNFALGGDWPVEDEVNADEVLQWAESQALFLTDRLMTDYERRIALLVVTTTNVGTVSTIASLWSDPVNSTPFFDLNDKIENFRQRTGNAANTLIIPEQVASKLRGNSQIRDILFGDRGGLASAEQLASLFPGINKVLIPASQVNTAAEFDPQGGTLANIWGNNVYLAKIDTLQGRFTDTWLNAFRWTSPQLGVPFAVIRHPFDTKKRIFEIEVSYYQAEKIVSADLAERFAAL
ncbi:MAG: hypothetical protein V3S55_03785 [Nitrospiraceae bacterium]